MKRLNQQGGLALFVIVLLIVAAGAGYYMYRLYSEDNKKEITSFQQCVDAGGLIQESYPEVCVIDGHNFTNPNQSLDKTN